ncbi:DEAD/DEAH box helicase [Clostridium sp. SHJSY1]|uniref:DEAD/DEAH box helicase n=1 Tax=Clostridium sp. SHJSY1 TaxID=2942483 RepID=UPI0028758826|nr:DEAD/DEAH box helicase [Clostridium sp. SHJSY1]MDS0524548.1 DEAD/DEAH box helicase [Clostridium sp. SHJSY1]
MEKITFKDLNLKPDLLRAIEDLGYENPSQIQAEAIPIALEGNDLIGQAQTGTGKTAAFGCSLLNNLIKTGNVGAIVLAPTRELAIQVYEELNKLSKYEKITVLPIYGGDSIQKQMRELKRGVDVVVGTPGRVLDLIRRKSLNLKDAQFLVLDEADEMLNMGFIEDIEDVIKELPEERQTLLFSATMPPQIEKLAKKYMKKDAKIVNIKKVAMTVSKIKQGYFEVNQKNKFEALCRVLDFDTPNAAIIFCKTKKGVDDLVEGLQARNFVVEGMHGDMSQLHRMRTLKRFKEGSLNYLIATDVAARGIDVEGITHVINYDLTQDVESYVHRIGRTGRANREGTAYSFITPREFSMLNQIKRVTKGTITKMSVPTVDEILESKFNTKQMEIEKVLADGDYSKYIKLATNLCENYKPADVVATIMKMQFDKEMSFNYTGNVMETPKRESFEGGERSKNHNDVRLFFSIGKRDDLTPKTLVKFITEKANITGKKVNRIDILESFSFVTVDKDVSDKVLSLCTGNRINKRKVNVEVATKRK